MFFKKYFDNLFVFLGIISWCKVLYICLVIIISILVVILVFILILFWFNLNYIVFILEKKCFLYFELVMDKLFIFIFIIVWLIVVIKLY